MDQARAVCALVGTDLYCWSPDGEWGLYLRPDGTIGRSTTPELIMSNVLDVGVGSHAY